MDHIELYGRKYARNHSLVVSSLFHPDGTCNGTYRASKVGVYLSDLSGKERVFIRADGLGPVTVGRHDGKRFYMQSTSSLEDKWLGTPESYSATRDGAKALARALA